jgi:hypothetical protein
MVTTLQNRVPSQDFLYKAEQVMVGTLAFDSPANKIIGGLPAGAVVIGVIVSTGTAFNAATTNNINVGFSDDIGTTNNAYVAAQAIGPVGTVSPTMATTTNVPLSRATNVIVNYAQSGTAATAGAATVVVRFVVP